MVRERDLWNDAPKAAAERALQLPKGLGEGGQAAHCVGPRSLQWGSVGNARLMPLQPCSLLAQVPGAVTQRGSLEAHSRFFPVCPVIFENFFLLFRTITTDTKEESGCWGSEAGAQDATSQFLALSVCIHLWLASSATALGRGS